MKRIVALDVGEKRIGVAVSDPLGLTAQGVETIQSEGWKKNRERVADLMSRFETDRLLVGRPLSMSGNVSSQTEFSERFADLLREDGWQVRMADERMTTAIARRALLEGDVSRARRKGVIDKVAAVCILQGFLDAGGWKVRAQEVKIWKGGRNKMENENNAMEPENVIELVDEEGNTVRFEHVMTVQHEGEDYVLLAPLDGVEDMDDDEVLILRIEDDENGEEIYVSVEDEGVVEKVFEKYLEIVEDEE